jgi:hypothetical protein
MKSFEILYTKDPSHKKRKVYHDGLMNIEDNSRGSTAFKVVLLSEDNKVLCQLGEKDVSKYVSDSEVKIGAYQVQIEKENTAPDSISAVCNMHSKPETQTARPSINATASSALKRRIPFRPQPLLSRPSSSLTSFNTLKPIKQSTQQPPSLQVTYTTCYTVRQ